MDTSRFKRPETQTQRHTTTPAFGNTYPSVPKVAARRPRSIDGVQSGPLRGDAALRQPAPRQRIAAPILQKQRLTPMDQPRNLNRPRNRRHALEETLATVPARKLPPIDMSLPGDESPWRRVGKILGRGKWVKIRRVALRSAAAGMALIIITGGILVSQGYLKLHKVFKGGTVTAAALKSNVDPNLLKGEGSGRVNILLLGRGGGSHEAPDLTDTLMLASVDPVNHTSTLLSIPRDLWVDIPGQGAMKLNAAWETGEFRYLGKVAPGSTNHNAIQAGFDEVDQTIESVLGVTINYNMMVNFQAFQQAVDTVNGVSVNVPTDLVDPTMAWENNGSSVLAKAGVQAFDGKHALIYVRSRETTSDFARSQRQRSVMLALKSKVATAGTLSSPLKISGLMSAFGNNVQTDLSLNNASRLYSITKGVSDSKVASISLADANTGFVTTSNMNGQSVVIPKAGLFKYDAIQAYVRSQLKDPYIVKEKAKILVLNGSSSPGMAAAKAAELKSYGYNVIGTGDAPGNSWPQTAVVNLSLGDKAKYTKHYLEQRFNVTATKSLPDKTIQTNGADFVIIVGSDEATP
ncbi:MAG: LytR family transcriptional regulator [Candidatus Saccharibacteria bacterium]|nr:LytR family transcriptional regulator [Candidatus Saccharibacteria bacterium]